MKEMSHDVSVIIVSWNTADLLGPCLDSVLLSLQGVQKGELIVVDNNSSDNSTFLIEHTFPQVHLIKNDSNRGFSQANNQGIEASTGRYLLLLNSDTVVNDDLVPNLIAFMDEHADAGACGVRLVCPDGKVQSFGFGDDPSLMYLTKRALYRFFFKKSLHNWDLNHIVESDWVSGACLMLRRDVVQLIGSLDQNFLMYFEDNDICLRIRKAGWKVFYNPHISITHIGGQSLSKNTEAWTYYHKSLLYFYEKHYGRIRYMILKALLRFYTFIPGCFRENSN